MISIWHQCYDKEAVDCLQGSVDVLKKLVKSKPTVSDKTGRKYNFTRPKREKFEAFICGE